jgi:hypothetical protein
LAKLNLVRKFEIIVQDVVDLDFVDKRDGKLVA